MQAADVEFSEKDKQNLKDEGALPATEHISLANANYGQGLHAPDHRSQEPESDKPDRPYTRIGGKKKTRRRRKRKRKTKRKTKRKRKRKTKRKTKRKRKRKTRRKRNRTRKRKKICRFR